MKPLFGKAGLKKLRDHLQEPFLLTFDFDGVLAPLTMARQKARPKKTTLLLLRELARKHPVAVVTGRAVSDVRPKLGFRPRFLVGNHGVEGLKEFVSHLKKARGAAARWHRVLATVVREVPGIDLETKKISLALHYRKARNKKLARDFILAASRKLVPRPRVILGKDVVNLVFPGSPTKGDAVQALLRRTGLRRAIYAGDDITDEDVFRLRDRRILTIRVGYRRVSAAAFFIPGQKDIDRLLRLLI